MRYGKVIATIADVLQREKRERKKKRKVTADIKFQTFTMAGQEGKFPSKKGLKIPKGKSKIANRKKTDKTMAKTKKNKRQQPQNIHGKLKIEQHEPH